jgi:hypothetical protein
VTRSLTDLEAGHVFDAITFVVTPEAAQAYRAAVDEHMKAGASPSVPPLALAAFALGRLLEHVGLPAGSLHTSESLEFHQAVSEGSIVECRARLSQRSVRSGWVVSVLDSEILAEGTLAVSARATVLSPGTGP